MAISNLNPTPTGPSLSEITTGVAAAVPTISAINTAVASNAPSPNAWTLVATSAALNYNTSSITFSGLSGYKTYKLLVPYVFISGGSDTLALRINSDATNDIYSRSGWNLYNQQINSQGGTSPYHYITALNTNANIYHAEITIKNANISAPKEIESQVSTNWTYGGFFKFKALYNSTSAVNSITFYNHGQTGTFGSGRSIYLLGAN
jgi:hypothetical protein